jgi:hypothetical protein
MSGYESYGIESGKIIDPDHLPHFLELAEDYPDEGSPLLDQKTVSLRDLTPDQQHWRDFGYVIKKQFIPPNLINEYLILRDKLNLGDGHFMRGDAADAYPYLYSSVIRDICCSRELHYLLVDLFGEEMGLQFTLNSFKSTERGWHQDDYFNPGDSMAHYCAVWMAMDDIHPDSGPFEFVPGSHKWPCLSGDKVKVLIKPDAHCIVHEWVTAAEYFVNKAVENYMKEVGSEAVQFHAKKGDILIWHAKMMHRGSIPRNPLLSRPALIAHYPAVRHFSRYFGKEIRRHGNGGYFWERSADGLVLTEDKIGRGATLHAPNGLAADFGDAAASAKSENEVLRAECSNFQSIFRKRSWWRRIGRRLNIEKAGKSSEAEVAFQKSRELTAGCSRGDATTISATQDTLQEIDKDSFIDNYFVRDLERCVKDEAFLFNENATEWYYKPAEQTMDGQWQYVQSFLSKHSIDYTTTLELSCGHGRNSKQLSELAKNLVLVDVVPENILFCRNRFPNEPWRFVINNGFDLREISNNSISFVYCFEAAVHFDLEIILSYIKEFRRVMTPGAFGFVHHSNVTANPGKDWKTHSAGRNFMSKEIFAHLCIHNRLEIVDQHVFHQGGPEADCFSLFRKNAD